MSKKSTVLRHLLSQEEVAEDQAQVASVDEQAEAAGLEVPEVPEVADPIEEVREVISEGEEIGEAIDTAEELDDVVTALESILADRAPTTMELSLIQAGASRAFARLGIDAPLMPSFEGFGDLDTVSLEARQIEHARSLQVALEEAGEGIWASIKKALARIGEAFANAWKKFCFWCKSAHSQVTQFRRELNEHEGGPKHPQMRFDDASGFYTGIGNELDPTELIKHLEAANNYVYRDLFNNLAAFSASGENPPSVEDEHFDGLPGEPRIRVNEKGASFIVNPPRCKVKSINVPSAEELYPWIDAFLEETLYFIRNYNSFKSTAEKIYDAIGGAASSQDGDVGDAMKAGGKILFARSHSCIETMQSWVGYCSYSMHAHHQMLMGLRKCYGF